MPLPKLEMHFIIRTYKHEPSTIGQCCDFLAKNYRKYSIDIKNKEFQQVKEECFLQLKPF